jgi:hypothetical protein
MYTATRKTGSRKRYSTMHPIRQIIDDAPPSFQLPAELHHKKLEIIIWPLYEQATPAPRSFKSLLMKMPNVGNDTDFARQRDFGRGGETWDF